VFRVSVRSAREIGWSAGVTPCLMRAFEGEGGWSDEGPEAGASRPRNRRPGCIGAEGEVDRGERVWGDADALPPEPSARRCSRTSRWIACVCTHVARKALRSKCRTPHSLSPGPVCYEAVFHSARCHLWSVAWYAVGCDVVLVLGQYSGCARSHNQGAFEQSLAPCWCRRCKISPANSSPVVHHRCMSGDYRLGTPAYHSHVSFTRQPDRGRVLMNAI
jgi:hypothetical protein